MAKSSEEITSEHVRQVIRAWVAAECPDCTGLYERLLGAIAEFARHDISLQPFQAAKLLELGSLTEKGL